MTDSLARAEQVIQAPRSVVWARLLEPQTLTRIMPVTRVLAPWKLGERFEWEFNLGGRTSTVSGVVHRLEAPSVLAYEFVDPLSRGEAPNVHQVVVTLSDEGLGTRVVVTQDANFGELAWKHAEGGWRFALGNFRWLVERGIGAD